MVDDITCVKVSPVTEYFANYSGVFQTFILFIYFEQMADILRRNYVALISTLREQEFICDLLIERSVISQCNKEDILCERTNAARNRVLLDYIRCRFAKGFQIFCEGLEMTNQHHLLNLMKPQSEKTEEETTFTKRTECKICLNLPVRIAFNPCGHACCCQSCAAKVSVCPLCRMGVQGRLKIYL